MRLPRTLAVLATTAVATLVLAGCGGGGNGSEAPVASNSPQCGDVWKVGARIAGDYDGCLDSTEHLVAAVKTNCTDGSELTTYDDRFWAVLGSDVHAVATGEAPDSDPDYQAALSSCEG